MYPEPCVCGVIFNKDGEIFIMRSPEKWAGKYIIPGGHIEVGESIEQALAREIKEETGLDVAPAVFLRVGEMIIDPKFYQKKHFINFDYACEALTSKVVLNEEGVEYLWKKPEDALKYDLVDYTRETIKIYINKMKESNGEN